MIKLYYLSYLFEASIRKFIYSAQSVIAIKYFFFIFLFLKQVPNYSWFQYTLVGSSLPLLFLSLLHNTNTTSVIFDYFCLIIVPIFIYTSRYTNFPVRVYNNTAFPYLCIFGGTLNSIITILQATSPRLSILNLGVDGDYSFHFFRSGLFFKASGLTAISSPFLGIAALVSIWYLREHLSRKSLFLLVSEIFIVASVFFNISSKLYFFGILFSYILRILLISRLTSRTFFIASSLCLLIPILSIFLFIFSPGLMATDFDITDFFQDRYSLLRLFERFVSNFDFVTSDFLNARHEFVGLGVIVGSIDYSYLPLSLNLDTQPFCSGLLREWEFPRIICLAGPLYGLFLILLLKVYFSVHLILYGLRRRFIVPSSSLIYVFIGIITLLQFQYYFNDFHTGLVILALLASYIDTSQRLFVRTVSAKVPLS